VHKFDSCRGHCAKLVEVHNIGVNSPHDIFVNENFEVVGTA
jgi:hypothetical protein